MPRACDGFSGKPRDFSGKPRGFPVWGAILGRGRPGFLSRFLLIWGSAGRGPDRKPLRGPKHVNLPSSTGKPRGSHEQITRHAERRQSFILFRNVVRVVWTHEESNQNTLEKYDLHAGQFSSHT